jgi:hypothetical protein
MIPSKRQLLTLGFTVLCANLATAGYDPIPLTPGTFTADVVVEKTAPPPLQSFITATMDGGTNNNGWVWFAQGHITNYPGFGLAPAASSFVPEVAPDHEFRMPSDYATNNALLIGSQVTSGKLTLATPAPFNSISVLGAGGGACTLNCVIRYQNGNVETNQFDMLDWFNTAPGSFAANGRVNSDSGNIGALGTGTPKLFHNDFALSDATTPVTAVEFYYLSGGRAAIFAVSGSVGGNFAPVTISGFNRDMIVEPGATTPNAFYGATTATMDTGTTNTGNTWYEKGFGGQTTGLPLAGSTFTNGIRAWRMAPSYAANNALLIAPNVAFGTLTLSAPATLSSLTVLNSAGTGPVNIDYTVYHVDGSTESGTFSALDWLNTTANAYTANGRFNTDTAAFGNVNANPQVVRLFFNDITVSTASPVSRVDFSVPGVTGRVGIFALSGQAPSSTMYLPLAINGYNHDLIFEATAVRLPAALRTATAVSMDGGTNNTGATWYEQGYYKAFPYTGLPAAGSQITSSSLPDHKFQMPATYTGNNAVFVDAAHPVANITPQTPGWYSGLSFLSATANNNVTNQVVMQYSDGTTETNVFTSVDWFNNNPYALTTLGRVNLDSRTINNSPGHTTTPNPRLYEAQFALRGAADLGNQSYQLTNIILSYINAINPTTARMVVMAMSGTTGQVVPVIRSQPSSLSTIEGSNVVLAVVMAGGTPPFTYQWQVGTNNVWVNATAAGTISGVDTPTLTFTSIGWTNAASYRFIATGAAGSSTSAVATVTVYSGLSDVTKPSDPITGIRGTTPAAEVVANAINNNTTKWLNYDTDTAVPFVGPVGFVVTPSMGSTVVKLLRFYTANDSDIRDPADYMLEGSNNGGTTWTLIASNALALSTTRNAAALALNPLTQAMQEVRLNNNAGFTSYRVTFSNVRNNTTANSMQIAEVELLGGYTPAPPIITLHPLGSIKAYAGSSPVLNAAASGPPTLAYQWYQGANLISGATDASLKISNVQFGDSGKTFFLRVSNPYGSVDTTSATLTVVPKPTQSYPVALLSQNPVGYWRLGEPDNGNGNEGVTAVDYAGGNNGTYHLPLLGQPGYNPDADADTAAQFGSPATESYVGEIEGINFATPTNSSSAFAISAWVKGQPADVDAGLVTKGAGGAEQFSLGLGAANPRRFRFYIREAGGTALAAVSTLVPDGNWHHLVGVCDQPNGRLLIYVDGILSGTNSLVPSHGILASSSPLSIGSRKSGAATTYDYQFSGVIDEVAAFNYALSPSQVLAQYFAANPPPAVSIQPTNSTVAEGTTATLYAAAYGPAPLAYQWYNVTGGAFTRVNAQTNSNLVISNAPVSLSGNEYQLVVTNPYGSVTSSIASLTIFSGPPTIIADVVPTVLAYAGRTVSLSVIAGGTAPFTYKWMKDSVQLSGSARISGTSSNVLTLSDVRVSDSGSYQVEINNLHGTAYSSPSVITVITTPTFLTNGLGWSLNGGATIIDDVLTLTDGGASLSRSSFFEIPLYVGGFSASMVYQDTTPSGGGADGFAFVVQNDPRGTAAVGGAGGGMAYTGITPSVAVMFNIYSGAAGGVGIALGVNGVRLSDYSSTAPVDISSGDPILVNLYHNSGRMWVTLKDLFTSAAFSGVFDVGHVPTIMGSETAYVGVTGASGGTVSSQIVKSFKYLPLPALRSKVVGGAVVLSWPTSVGGYKLQSRAEVGAGVWTDVAAQATLEDGERQVIIVTSGAQFYRLVME